MRTRVYTRPPGQGRMVEDQQVARSGQRVRIPSLAPILSPRLLSSRSAPALKSPRFPGFFHVLRSARRRFPWASEPRRFVGLFAARGSKIRVASSEGLQFDHDRWWLGPRFSHGDGADRVAERPHDGRRGFQPTDPGPHPTRVAERRPGSFGSSGIRSSVAPRRARKWPNSGQRQRRRVEVWPQPGRGSLRARRGTAIAIASRRRLRGLLAGSAFPGRRTESLSESLAAPFAPTGRRCSHKSRVACCCPAATRPRLGRAVRKLGIVVSR